MKGLYCWLSRQRLLRHATDVRKTTSLGMVLWTDHGETYQKTVLNSFSIVETPIQGAPTS
jgi:hypothetical protein